MQEKNGHGSSPINELVSVVWREVIESNPASEQLSSDGPFFGEKRPILCDLCAPAKR
jgi:hypothetical protein